MTDCASIMRCTSFWKAYIDRNVVWLRGADCKSNKHGPRAWTHVLTDK